MLGDYPDPSVTTKRVGVGTTFGHTREGFAGCAERLGSQARGKTKNKVGLETVNESKGDAATTRGCKFENKDGNRVPMQCE